MNDDIKDVDKIVDMVVNSEELRMAIMDKMLAKYERNLDMAEAHAKGKKEVAKSMKNDGEPIEKIMKHTGLTKEEIENL